MAAPFTPWIKGARHFRVEDSPARTREQLVSAMVNIDALTSQMLKLLAKQTVQDINASHWLSNRPEVTQMLLVRCSTHLSNAFSVSQYRWIERVVILWFFFLKITWFEKQTSESANQNEDYTKGLKYQFTNSKGLKKLFDQHPPVIHNCFSRQKCWNVLLYLFGSSKLKK